MLNTMSVALLAVLTLIAVGYAHVHLAALSPNARQLWLTRVILIVIGIGFGWVVVAVYQPVTGLLSFWVFLASFGVVHVPAAAVVFIKRQQRLRG